MMRSPDPGTVHDLLRQDQRRERSLAWRLALACAVVVLVALARQAWWA